MRIALINPSFSCYGGIKGHGGSTIPLGLCYLAAYVKKDNEVAIFDAEAHDWGNTRTALEMLYFRPDLIGITTNTPVFSSVINLCKEIRMFTPNAKIVLGGPHVSALPEQSLKETGADIVVRGEGELAFSDIVNGDTSPISQRELIDNLDILPLPARDLLEPKLYSPPPTKTVSNENHTLIASSRGCPFTCGFCGANTVWQNKTRARSITSVVREIQWCIHDYNIRSFSFTDEYFTFNKDRVREFCESILHNNIRISWVCSARAQGLDTTLLRLMKQAGCREISFGIESGDETILRNIDKRINLNEARRVVNDTQKVGIATHCSYMFGYIGETQRTVKNTIRYAKEINSDYAAFFIASPLPGTRLWCNAKEMGYLRKADWSDYSPLGNGMPVLQLPTISGKDLKKWHRRAIREYYFRWGYIWARLFRVRHWYEIVNMWKGFLLLFRIK